MKWNELKKQKRISTPSSDIKANSNGIARQVTESKTQAISIDSYENTEKRQRRLYGLNLAWTHSVFLCICFFVFALFFSMLREDHITVTSRLRGENLPCILHAIAIRCNEHSGAKQKDFHQKEN